MLTIARTLSVLSLLSRELNLYRFVSGGVNQFALSVLSLLSRELKRKFAHAVTSLRMIFQCSLC